MPKQRIKYYLACPIVLLLTVVVLSSCDHVMVLDPKGPIAAQQKDLILITLAFCLIPTAIAFALTVYFGFRYREKCKNPGTYQPNWSKNTALETTVWSLLSLIVAILSVITVYHTFELEPSKPIVSDSEELVVQVTSLDWKWLFLYPDLDIATVNYLYIPAGKPIRFELTSDAPMNSFWIPQLGGQIYTMSGMAMTLHLKANVPGTYHGFGANFSGERFADMMFEVNAVREGAFYIWTEKVKSESDPLTTETYKKLASPGTANTQSFAGLPKGLFKDIVTKYAPSGADHLGHDK